MPLQIDATHAVRATRSATRAYDTYQIPALPPTPISTVSASSLRAAMHPADVPYLYYVLSDANGKHAFAADLRGAPPQRRGRPGRRGCCDGAPTAAGHGPTVVAGVIGDPGRALALARDPQRGVRARSVSTGCTSGCRCPRAGATRRSAPSPRSGIAGVNVTMPHKADAAEACDVLTGDAAALGAVNTVVVRPDGSLLGDSTDGAGFLVRARRARGRSGRSPRPRARRGWRGAGDRARARPGRGPGAWSRPGAGDAAAAAAELATGAEAHDWGDLATLVARGDVIVNATPLGMGGEAPPFDPALIGPRHVVVDTVYHPPETPLLAAARARGARAENGARDARRPGRARVHPAHGLRPARRGDGGRASPSSGRRPPERAPGAQAGIGPRPADNRRRRPFGPPRKECRRQGREEPGCRCRARSTRSRCPRSSSWWRSPARRARSRCATRRAGASSTSPGAASARPRPGSSAVRSSRPRSSRPGSSTSASRSSGSRPGSTSSRATASRPGRSVAAARSRRSSSRCSSCGATGSRSRRSLPSLDCRPDVVDDLDGDRVVLDKAGFRVLRVVDGERNVREIARAVGRSVLEVCKVLKDLVEAGAVVVPTDPARTVVDELVLDRGRGAPSRRRARVPRTSRWRRAVDAAIDPVSAAFPEPVAEGEHEPGYGDGYADGYADRADERSRAEAGNDPEGLPELPEVPGLVVPSSPEALTEDLDLASHRPAPADRGGRDRRPPRSGAIRRSARTPELPAEDRPEPDPATFADDSGRVDGTRRRRAGRRGRRRAGPRPGRARSGCSPRSATPDRFSRALHAPISRCRAATSREPGAAVRLERARVRRESARDAPGLPGAPPSGAARCRSRRARRRRARRSRASSSSAAT